MLIVKINNKTLLLPAKVLILYIACMVMTHSALSEIKLNTKEAVNVHVVTETNSCDFDADNKNEDAESIHMGKGEYESKIVRVTLAPSITEEKYIINVSTDRNEEYIEVSVFRLLKVFGRSESVFDPLQIYDKENDIEINNECEYYYIRVKTSVKTKPGRYVVTISVSRKDAKNNDDIKVINIPVLVYPVVIEPINNQIIQGNLLTGGRKLTYQEVIFLLKILREYKFSSIVIPKYIYKEKPDLYWNLVREAFDIYNYAYVRIPPPVLFTRKKTLSQYLKENKLTLDEWTVSLCYYYDGIVSGIQKKYRKRLLTKLWDEPVAKNYSEVRISHKALNSCGFIGKIEITEHPKYLGENIADIWVLHVNDLIKSIKNKTITDDSNYLTWMYANKLHDIDNQNTNMRLIGWVMWMYKLDGYHFWSVTNWKIDPFVEFSSRKNFWGRGTLLYLDASNKKILPSLRIEYFRDGIEDMSLLLNLSKKNIVLDTVAMNEISSVIGGEKLEMVIKGKNHQIINYNILHRQLLQELSL